MIYKTSLLSQSRLAQLSVALILLVLLIRVDTSHHQEVSENNVTLIGQATTTTTTTATTVVKLARMQSVVHLDCDEEEAGNRGGSIALLNNTRNNSTESSFALQQQQQQQQQQESVMTSDNQSTATPTATFNGSSVEYTLFIFKKNGMLFKLNRRAVTLRMNSSFDQGVYECGFYELNGYGALNYVVKRAWDLRIEIERTIIDMRHAAQDSEIRTRVSFNPFSASTSLAAALSVLAVLGLLGAALLLLLLLGVKTSMLGSAFRPLRRADRKRGSHRAMTGDVVTGGCAAPLSTNTKTLSGVAFQENP